MAPHWTDKQVMFEELMTKFFLDGYVFFPFEWVFKKRSMLVVSKQTFRWATVTQPLRMRSSDYIASVDRYLKDTSQLLFSMQNMHFRLTDDTDW